MRNLANGFVSTINSILIRNVAKFKNSSTRKYVWDWLRLKVVSPCTVTENKVAHENKLLSSWIRAIFHLSDAVGSFIFCQVQGCWGKEKRPLISCHYLNNSWWSLRVTPRDRARHLVPSCFSLRILNKFNFELKSQGSSRQIFSLEIAVVMFNTLNSFFFCTCSSFHVAANLQVLHVFVYCTNVRVTRWLVQILMETFHRV